LKISGKQEDHYKVLGLVVAAFQLESDRLSLLTSPRSGDLLDTSGSLAFAETDIHHFLRFKRRRLEDNALVSLSANDSITSLENLFRRKSNELLSQ